MPDWVTTFGNLRSNVGYRQDIQEFIDTYDFMDDNVLVWLGEEEGNNRIIYEDGKACVAPDVGHSVLEENLFDAVPF